MTKKAKSNKKRKRTIQSQTRDEGNNYLMTRREIVKKNGPSVEKFKMAKYYG